MDRIKKKILLCLMALSAAMAVAATPDKALAFASAHSTALLDWAGISFTQEGDLTLPLFGAIPATSLTTLVNVRSTNNWNAFSGATNPYEPGVANSLGNEASAFEETPHPSFAIGVTGADAMGWTPAAMFNGNTGTETFASAGPAVAGSRAQATSWYNSATDYLLDGIGTLTIELDYYLALDLDTGGAGQTASGLASVRLAMAFLDPGTSALLGISVDGDQLANSVADGSDYDATSRGTLSVSLTKTVAGPVALAFLTTDANTEAQAAVPEPATFLLLGSGLIGAACIRGRQKRP